ncbi:MAG: molybdopterin molybdotransferase MoeA [Lachnospiraceae bacterium]|nr:molybdopterin molybdotransferase MoeA [Lachnospiraceae bacterium]
MEKCDHKEAVSILTDNISTTEICTVSLDDMYGRILAEDIVAKENVPAFARSPYDGYAFRAMDTLTASKEEPVKLKVLENIRAGQVAENEVLKNTAIRLMTGAPIPEGADCVCKFEDTVFTDEEVRIDHPYSKGENVISEGEDIKKGTLLAKAGERIDVGIIGTAASLGTGKIKVYKRPLAGIIATGDEIVGADDWLPYGKIRNSNSHTIAAALSQMGIDSVYLGHAKDSVSEIEDLISKGEVSCDVIISTGGVSVGDYDLVPDAMEKKGYRILVNGVKMKPGMACAYGIKDGRLMLGLSGNPASSLTNLQCICAPALRKLQGLKAYDHKIIKMLIREDFTKGSNGVRFIRGSAGFDDGRVVLKIQSDQGNIVISSMIGCNAYGIVPKDRIPVFAGDIIEGFLI